MDKNKGFTIVELMVTVSVAVLLITVALPSVSSMVWNNQVRSQTFELVSAINLARSEAIRRRVPVILCRSDNPESATPSCGGTNNTWSSGWLVFTSRTNQTYEPGVGAGADELLRAVNIDSSGVTIKTNDTSNHNLVYGVDGTTDESGDTASFVICDSRGGAYGRQIKVPPVGRAVIIKGDSDAVLNCESPV